MKEILKKIYEEWRQTSIEQAKDSGLNLSLDCGEKAVREDFTAYAGLTEEITYEKMLELEEEYKSNL